MSSECVLGCTQGDKYASRPVSELDVTAWEVRGPSYLQDCRTVCILGHNTTSLASAKLLCAKESSVAPLPSWADVDSLTHC